MTPTSHPDNKALFRRVALAGEPGSILDVCAGTGDFGTLARIHRPAAQIDGVEVWEPYCIDGKGCYDRMIVGDALEVIPTLGHYDLALFIGALEHFEREDGKRMLELCAAFAETTLLVTPCNPSKQGAVNDNPYEVHRSAWSLDDLAGYETHVLLNKGRIACLFGREEREWWGAV